MGPGVSTKKTRFHSSINRLSNHRDSYHYENKTVVIQSYLYNGNFYTGSRHRIPISKIRRLWDSLIFITGILLLVKWYRYIDHQTPVVYIQNRFLLLTVKKYFSLLVYAANNVNDAVMIYGNSTGGVNEQISSICGFSTFWGSEETMATLSRTTFIFDRSHHSQDVVTLVTYG